MVNKLVQVLSFGSFDEYLAEKKLPASYSPAQVSLVMRGSVWPLGWRSRRKFFNWSGAGTMRNYLCTVAADEHHVGRVLFSIQVEDEPDDVTVGATPEELIAAFKARFERLFMNPIHSSWIRSAEFFFGFNSDSVQERVRALPGHREVLALLEPYRQAAGVPAAARAAGQDDTDSDDDIPEKRRAQSSSSCSGASGVSVGKGSKTGAASQQQQQQQQPERDYTRLTEVRARELLSQKEEERARLDQVLQRALVVLTRLCATNDEWRALEQNRLARALTQYTAATTEAVATGAAPAPPPSPPRPAAPSRTQPRAQPALRRPWQ